ncbi:MAG: glutathione S-transferase family protein [Burkholderiaceae bacterium]
MQTLILHHYPMSPFAEKMRRILAWKKLAWGSVIIPSIMPKPDVVALTGGYRKTPILQVGADIYCDTALICDVLEHAQPQPALYPEHAKGLSRTLAQWADTTLFWASMAHNFNPVGAAQLFPGASADSLKAFADDRSKMRLGAPRMRPSDATPAYRSYLRRIASMLDGQDYLLGAQACVADFAVYHPLWFTRTQTPAMAGVLDATPAVLHWMDRIAAMQEAPTQEITSTQALDIACAGMPHPVAHEVFQDEHAIALGSQVSIAGESFGPEASEGELVAATRMHYTIRRTDARAGTVHVHLPRIGYSLRAVKTA